MIQTNVPRGTLSGFGPIIVRWTRTSMNRSRVWISLRMHGVQVFHVEQPQKRREILNHRSVPRETSCKCSRILIRSARLGESIGSHHCDCKSKGWSWQDHYRGEPGSMSCHGRSAHTTGRLRFPGKRLRCHRFSERPLPAHAVSRFDLE